MKIRGSLILILSLGLMVFQTSCKKEKSSVTGWNYNDPKWGGFENYDYAGQETGPGLVYVKGGAFTMGSAEQDVLYDHNNIERKVTVASFYMDECEISNLNYLEYLHWIRRVYVDYPEVYLTALPDTACWREELAYNEPYVEEYLRHPAYKNYPVVGVNWLQATAYAAWRTDRVNEMILVREGIIELNPDQMNEENFNKGAYLAGQYQPVEGKHPVKDIMVKKGTRQVKMEDGIFLPDYRLPTEAEWEYAALAHIGQSQYENTDNKNVYSWGGLTVRHHDDKEKYRGLINANFKRGKGDQGGIASRLNDGALISTEVRAYWPNDYGLYNMSGNVSEWVMDVYRALTIMDDAEDFNSFRGNVYVKKKMDDDGFIEYKDSLGRLIYVPVEDRDNIGRRNYKVADNMGYLDEETYNDGEQQYEYGVTSLVNNRARVYKGGSWNDRAYFLSPGTRRFLDEEQSLSTLGFRCAMHKTGAP